MTLRELVSGQSTIEQLRMLMLADTLFTSREHRTDWRPEMALIGQVFADRSGRYYGGQLTADEIYALTKKPKSPASATPKTPQEQTKWPL